MRYYPINLDLRGKTCVIFGGGRIAERKTGRLLECGAHVVIVAPELTPGLAELAEARTITHIRDNFDEDYLDDASLIIGATDDEAINAEVSAACAEVDALCNIVDDPARCTFTLPAVVQRGEFCLAISTGGKSPALAKRVRQELEKLYGEEYAEFVELLGMIRDRVMADEAWSEAERAAKFERLAGSELPRLLKEKDGAAINALLAEVLGEGFSLGELLSGSRGESQGVAEGEPAAEGLGEAEAEGKGEGEGPEGV
jgi:precorrin-2 dehydrogenase/sirohydrochlorin ferrochelatase